MTNKHLVILIRHLKHKTQSERVLILTGCRVVAYILSSSEPTVLSLFLSSLRMKQNLHAVVVVRVVLHKIGDVEPVGHPLLRIGESEVKPLGVALRVVVRAHGQVVLKIRHLHSSLQVSRLKPRLEYKCGVLFRLEHVVGVKLCEVLVVLWDRCREEALGACATLVVSEVRGSAVLEFPDHVGGSFDGLAHGVVRGFDLFGGVQVGGFGVEGALVETVEYGLARGSFFVLVSGFVFSKGWTLIVDSFIAAVLLSFKIGWGGQH